MAADEALVLSVAKGGPPVFRVYTWSPPAISFGYAQHIAAEIDLPKCREHHIDIVRRTTGGRAVLHWNELTYSVICHQADPAVGGSIQEAYRKISLALMKGITHLGVDVSFESRRLAQPAPRGKELTAPCFTSTAQHEVTLGGRKLIGSAQQRVGQTLLQHGSLLLGPEHKRIVDFFPAGKERLRDRFSRELDAHTVSLGEARSHPVAFTSAAEVLKRGWIESFPDTQLVDSVLSPEETATLNRLIAEKYGSEAWNFKR
ncbi:MAG: biotin/lipoate A/B protein ligase family protein [bacterium]|jgi:lipoyl(octanoyl) transferase|nr:biotin/lipoate A/B protein ligase family protein [bacterium]